MRRWTPERVRDIAASAGSFTVHEHAWSKCAARKAAYRAAELGMVARPFRSHGRLLVFSRVVDPAAGEKNPRKTGSETDPPVRPRESPGREGA